MTPHEDLAQGFTPTYRKLWHRDFSLLMAAHLLIATALCYMITMLPAMLRSADFTATNVCWMTGAWILGGLLAGVRINHLVQRYRRKRVFTVSVWALGLCFALFEYLYTSLCPTPLVLTAASFAVGAAFCLAQRVLACTLVVDKTEAFHRTEANYVTAWLTRFGVALGAVLALLLGCRLRFDFLCTLPLGFLLLAWACVALVHIPFKAPEENVPQLSADRFFLSSGRWLFLGKMLAAMALGIVFAQEREPSFYVMLLPGCLIGILCERIRTIRCARMLSAAVCLVAIIGLTVLPPHVAAVILGASMGMLGSRVLFRLLYQSEHCQRSSAMSTYFLAWDWGFVLGVSLCWTGLLTAQNGFQHLPAALILAAALVCLVDDREPMKRPEDTRRFLSNDL